MKIGLDFDGVITDCGRLKSEGAKEIYGVEVPAERFKREFVVGSGILTSEQYTAFQRLIYDDEVLGIKMFPVEGALEYIQKLQREAYELVVVSSRGVGNKLQVARKWMDFNGLELPIIGVNLGTSKAEACKGLDVYIDDDLDKLEPLANVVPHRYLFSWGYNLEFDVSGSSIKRVSSWPDFYDEVSRISR